MAAFRDLWEAEEDFLTAQQGFGSGSDVGDTAASPAVWPARRQQQQRQQPQQSEADQQEGRALLQELRESVQDSQVLTFSFQVAAGLFLGDSPLQQQSAWEEQLTARLTEEWHRVEAGQQLPIQSPAVAMAGQPVRGMVTVTMHIVLSVAAAEVLSNSLQLGLGGVSLQVAGHQVIAHLHVDWKDPLFLFTVDTSLDGLCSPRPLLAFMQHQRTSFAGMQVLWLGHTDARGMSVVQRVPPIGGPHADLDPCALPAPLRPFTLVGLAVGGQRALRSPVRVAFPDEAAVEFSLRRVPNRVRWVAAAVPAPPLQQQQQQQQQPRPQQQQPRPQQQQQRPQQQQQRPQQQQQRQQQQQQQQQQQPPQRPQQQQREQQQLRQQPRHSRPHQAPLPQPRQRQQPQQPSAPGQPSQLPRPRRAPRQARQQPAVAAAPSVPLAGPAVRSRPSARLAAPAPGRWQPVAIQPGAAASPGAFRTALLAALGRDTAGMDVSVLSARRARSGSPAQRRPRRRRRQQTASPSSSYGDGFSSDDAALYDQRAFRALEGR